MQEKLLSTKELAEYIGVTQTTLRQYRIDGCGPAYIKFGNRVRYRISDVENWICAKQTIRTY